ncbi:MAG: hypothetical protein COW75_10830 [Rhodobacterales bacterium CG18_big_fil_WC_8_21_14_2_50_71_9]|nr:MAG: hypothetical protein COW75_10830 [Rhodobacterales bacterium CG18_big_fil_WC_8_21_14_2_50_71_9]PIY74684.1 MAG: hypothetical protein COY86_01685 [Rhodobacterales bacterium CG_4_10_14_0_8_um_filter_70_9]PJA59763.1 MAG: hypothetical protein CO163_07505 [Rhodobacterales bacterium CG_4_9_14_3_um_filter_71_31]
MRDEAAMTDATDPKAVRYKQGAFRILWSFDRPLYAAHLRRLSPEDRRARFHHAVSDGWIDAHAAGALDGRGKVLGWFHDDTLRAAAEVALTRDGAAAEAAFDVEDAWRGWGVGSQLVARVLLWARNRGARRLLVHTTRGNVAMLRAATRNGAQFEFDLSEADGVIEAEGPTLRSHMEEARLAQEGARGLADQAARRMRALLRPAAPGANGA